LDTRRRKRLDTRVRAQASVLKVGYKEMEKVDTRRWRRLDTRVRAQASVKSEPCIYIVRVGQNCIYMPY